MALLFKWLQRNNLHYTDSYELEKLYNEKEEKEVIKILYDNIKEISEK